MFVFLCVDGTLNPTPFVPVNHIVFIINTMNMYYHVLVTGKRSGNMFWLISVVTLR